MLSAKDKGRPTRLSRLDHDTSKSANSQPGQAAHKRNAQPDQLSKINALPDQLSITNARLDQLTKAYAQLTEEKAHLSKANIQLQEHIYDLNKTLDSMSSKIRLMESSLEEKNAYLDTHDEFDDRTVAHYLVTINRRIEQLADKVKRQWPVPTKETKVDHNLDAYKDMRAIIGSRLARALDNCDILDDTTQPLFSYAVKTIITYHVFELFQARTFRTREHLVDHLSEQIQKYEIQPVYGRWRSLTQRYLRMTESSGAEEDVISRWCHTVSVGMWRVAQVYGFGFPKTSEGLRSDLVEIAKKVIQLSTVVMVDIISTDYELYCPYKGNFDPFTMEAALDLPERPQNDKIVSVLSLGLFTIGKPDRQQVKPQQSCVQKAVVITEADLAEIMAPTTKRVKEGQ